MYWTSAWKFSCQKQPIVQFSPRDLIWRMSMSKNFASDGLPPITEELDLTWALITLVNSVVLSIKGHQLEDRWFRGLNCTDCDRREYSNVIDDLQVIYLASERSCIFPYSESWNLTAGRSSTLTWPRFSKICCQVLLASRAPLVSGTALLITKPGLKLYSERTVGIRK